MRWRSTVLPAVALLLAAGAEAQHPEEFGPPDPGVVADALGPFEMLPAADQLPPVATLHPADTLPPADTLLPPDPLSPDTVGIEVVPDSARVPVVGSNGTAQPAQDCIWGPNRRAAQTAVGAAFVGANVELFRRFKQAWWSGEKADRFFFRDDWDQDFRDQDKFGHLWGGYHLTRAGHTLLRTACVSERASLWISALYATAFQLQIEIWDGMYEKYGFSWPDVFANTAGMGLAVLHAVKPGTEAIKPTISYRRTEAMKRRGPADELRYSLDYSGQTYWFSLDVDAVLPENARRYWPGILRLSLGHSITDWVLPREAGTPTTEPQTIVRARRKLLLSIDIDAGKLPGQHPAWRFVKRQLSFIRLPAPALQIAPDVDLLRWYR